MPRYPMVEKRSGLSPALDEPVADAKSARLLQHFRSRPWLSDPATAGPMVRVRDYLALLEVATNQTTGSDDEHVDAQCQGERKTEQNRYAKEDGIGETHAAAPDRPGRPGS